jgi:hypothetical protein
MQMVMGFVAARVKGSTKISNDKLAKGGGGGEIGDSETTIIGDLCSS